MSVVYKRNPHGLYALYSKTNSDVWRESASVTNNQIEGDSNEDNRNQKQTKTKPNSFCD